MGKELRDALQSNYGIKTTEGSTDWEMEEVYSKIGGGSCPATATLTVKQCKGTILNNQGQTAENTLTLPAAAKGLSGELQVSTSGAGALHLKAAAGDKFYFDGTALDDGDKVSLTVPLVGDYITFQALQTGATEYDWIVRTGQGAWFDGGA